MSDEEVASMQQRFNTAALRLDAIEASITKVEKQLDAIEQRNDP